MQLYKSKNMGMYFITKSFRNDIPSLINPLVTYGEKVNVLFSLFDERREFLVDPGFLEDSFLVREGTFNELVTTVSNGYPKTLVDSFIKYYQAYEGSINIDDLVSLSVSEQDFRFVGDALLKVYGKDSPVYVNFKRDFESVMGVGSYIKWKRGLK